MGQKAANWLSKTMEERDRQIDTIAEMLTDHPDVFCEEASGGMGGGGMAGNISKPSPASPPKRTADAPTQAGAEPIDAASDKPLTPADINKQADQMGGTEGASDVMADQMKVQQEMEKQQEVERQKMLKPQFDQLNAAMTGLQQGVLQGKQQTAAGGDQFTSLEKEMTGLNTLLGGLQKQL